MGLDFTQVYADQLGAAIQHAIRAHTYHAKTPSNAARLWDKQTPYVIHPIWCSMTLLTETKLTAEVRYLGGIALLWHDILEDTDLSLPSGTQTLIQQLVQEMTFASLDDEFEALWTRSSLAKLLKLYDKTSQFLDGVWLTKTRRKQLVQHTCKLEMFVLAEYGELNIVKLSRVLREPS